VQQFAPLLVGRIGPDAGTWRVRKVIALDAVQKKVDAFGGQSMVNSIWIRVKVMISQLWKH